MKILILTSELAPLHAGGIATYTSTIAPALAQRGHTVHVLSCAEDHARQDTDRDGVTWHTRPLLANAVARLHRAPEATLRLRSMASSLAWLRRAHERFDVIETPDWMALGFLIQLARSAPIVVHVHSPIGLLTNYNRIQWTKDRRVSDWFERSMTHRAQAVTTVSKLMASTLSSSGWLRTEPELIRYPIDVGSVEVSWPAGDAERNILFVGRLEFTKAPELLLEAASLLRERGTSFRLTFVGRSNGSREGLPYIDYLQGMAKASDLDVTFIEWLSPSDLRKLYADARVVAVPSRFDSFSIVALEAMAAARPVVCTSNTGAAEVIGQTGAGTVVPPDDPVSLAEALLPFLDDPNRATAAGAAARDSVAASCDAPLVAAMREACFSRAIARWHGPK